MRFSKTSCLVVVLMISAMAHGQLPVWNCTLNDAASIENDNWGVGTGGTLSGTPNFVATSVPTGSIAKMESTGDARAGWGTGEVQGIFGGWNDADGITVDLYFSGFASTTTGDRGLWSVGHRIDDHFFILVVRDDQFRFNIRSSGSGGTQTWLSGPLGLQPSETYRLTVRQHLSLGNGGDMEIYLESLTDGGTQYPYNTVLATFDLDNSYQFSFPLDAGGGEPLAMYIGQKYPLFGASASDFWPRNGEAIDEVKVYNASLTPAEIDTGGLPTAIINTDVTQGFVPLTVNFDGTSSFDTDGTDVITLYEWDFTNDGIVDLSGDEATAGMVSHQYTSVGSFECKLTVTDDELQTASTTVPIGVFSLPAPGVVTVTSIVPDGGPLDGSQPVTSITAGGDTFTDLVGPTTVELIPLANQFSSAQNVGLCSVDPDVEKNLLGLEMGRAVLGLGDPGEEFIRAFFPAGVAVDGDGTGKPEIFVLEYAGSTDTFQIQLLTSGPGETPVIAATVQVRSVDYFETSTVMSAFDQGVGGVGVDLDAVGVSGITGVQIPGDDGSATATGLDPCVIAAVTGPADTYAPVAELQAAPTSGGFPLFVSFTACTSYDPDGQPLTYAWDFESDGSDDDTGVTVTHTYSTAGSYTAKLTVTDTDTLIGTDTMTINVSGPNPKRRIIAFTADDLGGGSLWLTSVTTEFPGGTPTFEATDLVGPPDTQTNPPTYDFVDVFGAMTGSGIASQPDEAIVGLELGSYVSQLSTPGEFLRVYFGTDVVNPDGTDAPEVFVLEQASTTDNFQIQLLTNGPTEAIAVAATVQIFTGEYDNVGATRGGMGVDLDALGVAGIRGVQLPGADGLGGGTGLDPSVVAAVVVGCNFPFADVDGDTDVDSKDFAAFQLCLTGNGDPQGVFDATSCFCFDRAGDNDVDEFDFEDFRDCATGPDVPWSQALTPACIP